MPNSKKTFCRALLTFSFLSLPAFAVEKPKTETPAGMEKADFAAGCFWGSEEFFRKIPGVKDTMVGYEGGKSGVNYEDVKTGQTGDAETVQVTFDPKKVSYKELMTMFFKMHDPTTLNRQINDVGTQYRSAIFYHSEKQKAEATELMKQIEKSGAWKAKLTTEVAPAKNFTPAEDYHQKYLVKNPGGYDNHFMRNISFDVASDSDGTKNSKFPPKSPETTSGSAEPRYKIKDRPTDDVLKKQLTDLQYDVTRKNGTERPFVNNEYLHNYADGIYVDVISGEPLFSSKDKYDSKTGWPSFTKPLVKENVVEKTDEDGSRTEVRSKHVDSHLGHVFDDGPQPTGKRYCMNSAALRFIPKEKLKAEGYGEFLKDFDSAAGVKPTKK